MNENYVKPSGKFLATWYRERIYLNGAQLKYIAMVLMLLSHIAQTNFLYSLGPEYFMMADIFVLVGRLAMPIYCFFTVQALVFTSNIKKYFTRMLVFALASEIPFDLAFRDSLFFIYGQNVIFTLLIGAITIYGMDALWKSENQLALKIAGMAVVALLGMGLAIFLKTDYDWKGVFAIILLYLARYSRPLTALALAAGFLFEFRMFGLVMPEIYGFVYLSIPLILLYNGKRGRQNKWAFYIFYPAHLFVLYLLKLLI